MEPSKIGLALEAFPVAPKRPLLLLNIASTLEQVSDAVAAVGNWLENEGIDPECIGDITLVMAEALNNVIEHAYNFAPNETIQIRTTLRQSTMSVQIIDSGVPFDGPPAQVPQKEIGEEIADLPEGGFGWFLIQRLCDDIHFAHADGRNKLTLVLSVRPL